MPVSEKRTQLYLPQELHQKAKNVAEAENISMAALVRKALKEYFQKFQSEKEKDWKKDPLNNTIGFFEGDENLSESHDKYLYT
jgi:hypothetical protein